MGCKICGRNSCISSFHSIEEQEEFEKTSEQRIEKLEEQLNEALSVIEQMREALKSITKATQFEFVNIAREALALKL